MEKITIIGAGRVGEATAQLLAIKDLCRTVVLVDIREGAASGAALDIQESASLFGFNTSVIGDTHNEAMADSDLVIITAGVPRKPGMSRSDVLETNLAVINSVVDDTMQYAPNAMIMMVTNPVDVLTYETWRRTGWDKQRVFGLSGVLDSARMAAFVALETGFSAKDITAMVLGGHGDAMVPLPRYTCIRGIPIDHFISAEAVNRIVERTRQGGAEILALKKNSSAYNAPAAAITEMVNSIVHDRKQILSCVSILEGEYEERNVAMGVPAILGRQGLERVIELSLTPHEKTLFKQSVTSVHSDLDRISNNAA